jgi:hypothetical protein
MGSRQRSPDIDGNSGGAPWLRSRGSPGPRLLAETRWVRCRVGRRRRWRPACRDAQRAANVAHVLPAGACSRPPAPSWSQLSAGARQGPPCRRTSPRRGPSTTANSRCGPASGRSGCAARLEGSHAARRNGCRCRTRRPTGDARTADVGRMPARASSESGAIGLNGRSRSRWRSAVVPGAAAYSGTNARDLNAALDAVAIWRCSVLAEIPRLERRSIRQSR